VLGNNSAKEETINTITTKEYNVEIPKSEKKPRPLDKPTTRELSLSESFYNT
jgi:hypothetical protein